MLIDSQAPLAMRAVLTGCVQGLGVRPAIFRLAVAWNLAGTVRNTTAGVEIDIEGSRSNVEAFRRLLPGCLPSDARLDEVFWNGIPFAAHRQFIVASHTAVGPLTAAIPADIAACDQCLGEVADVRDRRHGYALVSCTSCGPRYSIIRAMPYERAATTMAAYPLCGPCRHEYEDPSDRRFHAQTTACPDCGPRVWCADPESRVLGRTDDAVRIAAMALRQGKIVALKGIGGYQLLADATDNAAVSRLRRLKDRPARPFAVLVGSIDEAERLAVLNRPERSALADRANPIVLVRARGNTTLSPSVHPGLSTVGLMLPTTPLHALLSGVVGQPLICTSGNREGEPLAWRTEGAQRTLAEVCDLLLHHDRPIERPIDDSVVRVIHNRPVTVRLARGLAPLTLDLPGQRPALALGGYFKSAAAWSNGQQAVLGPHVGDQQSLATRERFLDQCRDWQSLYRFTPELLAHDMHPDYFSTRWVATQGQPRRAVQHHHAHIVSGMIEAGLLDRTVLGVAWDGTGYGPDGTIWGGEFLIARVGGYQRFARLRPFPLPGGEAAVREPWRIAAVLMDESGAVEQADQPLWDSIGLPKIAQLRTTAQQDAFSPRSSSAGRLFDAVASIVLETTDSEYDGQPAMLLEAVADESASGCYPFPLSEGPLLELDWRPLIRAIVADQRAGAALGEMAMRFHRAMAAGIVATAARRPGLPVVLSGGVFQNRLLTELVAEFAADTSRTWNLPGRIPPNDGGLGAGQLAVALAE